MLLCVAAVAVAAFLCAITAELIALRVTGGLSNRMAQALQSTPGLVSYSPSQAPQDLLVNIGIGPEAMRASGDSNRAVVRYATRLFLLQFVVVTAAYWSVLLVRRYRVGVPLTPAEGQGFDLWMKAMMLGCIPLFVAIGSAHFIWAIWADLLRLTIISTPSGMSDGKPHYLLTLPSIYLGPAAVLSVFLGWLAFYAIAVFWWLSRASRRVSEKQADERRCVKCGYSLAHTLPRCPECGLEAGAPFVRRTSTLQYALFFAIFSFTLLLSMAPRYVQLPGARLSVTRAQEYYGAADEVAARLLDWVARND
jgi:hypothetical protein